MRRIKDDRSIITYLLLSLITFGIYAIWFLHRMTKDINELCREDGNRTPGVLALVLFSLLTCGLYGLFWWYRVGDILAVAVRKRNLNSSVSGSGVLICFVLGYFVFGIASWVGMHRVFEATNELAVEYNSRLTE